LIRRNNDCLRFIPLCQNVFVPEIYRKPDMASILGIDRQAGTELLGETGLALRFAPFSRL